MEQIKICPDCSSEFYAHIETCADCGAVLLWPEELKRVHEKRQRTMEETFEDPVAVREGDPKWMKELCDVLIDAGVPCVVHADKDCGRGCSGHGYRLVVSAKNAERAVEIIEDHCALVHPELRESRDLMSQGKCPACASPVSADARECADCGLILVIEHQDNGAGDSCRNGGSCSS